MSWLLDTDVLSQPAKRNGDPRVIAWLGREQEPVSYTHLAPVTMFTTKMAGAGPFWM